MDCIRDYLSTVLHLPVLLPCFAVFPVRFFVSRLVIAHTDAIRAKFYRRKRITFFSKNTFYPICSTQAKKTFSCSLDSKFPLVSQGGACSRTNWPIQPELIPVPLGWKDKENYIARLPPSPPPPRYHPTSLTIFRYPFILLSEERHYERFVFCSRTQFTVTRLGYEPEPLNLGPNAPSRRMPRHHWLFMSTEAVSLNAIAPWKAHYKRRTGRIWSSSVDKTRSPDCQKQSLRNSRTGFWRRRVYI